MIELIRIYSFFAHEFIDSTDEGFEIFYLSDKGAEENMQPKLLESELSGTSLAKEKDVSQKQSRALFVTLC